MCPTTTAVSCARCDKELDVDLDEFIPGVVSPVDCPRCRLSMNFLYEAGELQDWGAIGPLELKCPVCTHRWDEEIEWQAASDEFACPLCSAKLLATWEKWGAELEVGRELSISCPFCESGIEIAMHGEIGERTVECCGVELDVEWTGWGKEVWVSDGQAEETVTCSECQLWEVDLQDISLDEEGDEQVECDECGETFRVRWSQGAQVFYDRDGYRRDDSGIRVG